MKIIKPTLIIDKTKAVENIRRMAAKINKSPGGIRFRPHFKTHQSAQTGQWFRDLGITAITVSSVDMALYFAQNGWKDISIAVLVNPLEIQSIHRLTETFNADINLLVDSCDMAAFLNKELRHKVKLWIKIDTGYHRTGIEYHQKEKIFSTAEAINQSPNLDFKGLLTHSGHSYRAGSGEELKKIYDDTVTKMNGIRQYLKKKGMPGVEISIGDTPTCSVVEEFYGVDEIRCGNFVFYDVMQFFLGACKEEDIAAAVACPVIARYPQRSEIVVYGGAVHLSKESITNETNQKIFGLVAMPEQPGGGWGPVIENTYVSSLSQEHGIIKTTRDFIDRVDTGDIVMILPVHSCLAANLMMKQNFL